MKRRPAPFPFLPMFQNGPRGQGCAPENLFKPGKDFPPRAQTARPCPLRAVPKTFPGEGKGGKCKDKTIYSCGSVRAPVGRPRAARKVWSRQTIIGESMKRRRFQKGS